jgi:predicted secreted hydrolase
VHSYLGTEPDHYTRLNLTEDIVQAWEDGLRTDPDAESFEWWYLDCAMNDGSKLTVEFHTVPPHLSPSHPLTPFISLTLDRANGENITRTFTGSRDDFAASKDGCDVRIGANRFVGDLQTYTVHVEIDDVSADLTLRSQVPPWRPATGHLYCGDRYVAWLPTVPRGELTGTIQIGGLTEPVDGVGYHDHNWGTAPLSKLIDHWYWGRARIGQYTVLSLSFISHPDFGRIHHPALMVAKDGAVVASGHNGISFEATDHQHHPTTQVPVANTLQYQHQVDGENYTVRFERDRDVFLLDFGKAGAYHRFIGDVTLEHRVDGDVVDVVTDDALWELLYFGDRPSPEQEHGVRVTTGLVHKA